MNKKFKFSEHIILETEDYIVLNKPAGIACLKERGNANILDILSHARIYYADAVLCHRLDKYTSGALLIAKNEEAMRNGSVQFEHKKVKKIYHAIVHGATNFDKLEVDLPILIDENRRTVRINKSLGKKSKTVFTTLNVFGDYSLVECELHTGRMHQIRIHLSSIGHPIITDELYGGKEVFLSQIKHKYNYNRTGEESPLIKRFALHAFELGFTDLAGTWQLITAPYPKDFLVVKNLLAKNA